MSVSCVPGYGPPRGSDYPYIDKVVPSTSSGERYSRDDLHNCQTVNGGYMFYTIGDAVFAKDISGYFYKLNNTTKHFEWFSEGWLEDNEFTIGQTIPSAPTYISYNKHGLPVFPLNDEKPPKPILPKNEKGEKVFPMDPTNSIPLFPIDFYGEPCLPVGDDGRPIFPMGAEGRPIVPIDSSGIAVFPRSADGRVLFPEREDGRPIPPYTIYGNPVVPIKENGDPDLPVDANGKPLIFMGGDDGLTPMTEEEYHQWQYSSAMRGQGFPDEYGYDANMYEMSQNEQVLEAYKVEYYKQCGYDVSYEQAIASHGLTQTQPTQVDVEAEKKKKLIEMQMKSLKKAKGLEKAAEKKEQEKANEKGTPTPPPQPAVPAKPPLPNKEKERGERYIPEPISLKKYRRDFRRDDRVGFNNRGGFNKFRGGRPTNYRWDNGRRKSRYSRSPIRRSRSRSRSASKSRSRSPIRGRDRKRKSSHGRSRSRSLTWSPDPRDKRSKKRRDSTSRSSSRSRSASETDDERRRRKEKKKERKHDRKDKKKSRRSRHSDDDSHDAWSIGTYSKDSKGNPLSDSDNNRAFPFRKKQKLITESNMVASKLKSEEAKVETVYKVNDLKQPQSDELEKIEIIKETKAEDYEVDQIEQLEQSKIKEQENIHNKYHEEKYLDVNEASRQMFQLRRRREMVLHWFGSPEKIRNERRLEDERMFEELVG
ncbi:unnamed protein product [Caenorhabditis bovis]|uniref:Uncharacterized protein n=1 Tax=Caenorhabditis bovis TaxID=2654633 RepID=A0A8S1EPX7_9PELO|nr:unnamed protein product [Caenorhabditis bovis]